MGFVSHTLSQRLLSSSVHLLIAAISSKWLIHLLKLPVPLNFLGNMYEGGSSCFYTLAVLHLRDSHRIWTQLQALNRKNTRQQMTHGMRALELHYGILYTPDSINPRSFSLFVYLLVCPITRSFLDGFQPNLVQHFPHVCSTCHTIFSLKKTLECVCERLLHCRLIFAITWTPTNDLHVLNFQLHNLYRCIILY